MISEMRRDDESSKEEGEDELELSSEVGSRKDEDHLHDSSGDSEKDGVESSETVRLGDELRGRRKGRDEVSTSFSSTREEKTRTNLDEDSGSVDDLVSDDPEEEQETLRINEGVEDLQKENGKGQRSNPRRRIRLGLAHLLRLRPLELLAGERGHVVSDSSDSNLSLPGSKEPSFGGGDGCEDEERVRGQPLVLSEGRTTQQKLRRTHDEEENETPKNSQASREEEDPRPRVVVL